MIMKGDKQSRERLVRLWLIRLKPPEGGLVVLPEMSLHYPIYILYIEQAVVAIQSRFTGVTSDHAYPELSKVRDCENEIGTSIGSRRPTPRYLDHLSRSLSALCPSLYNLPRQAQGQSSSQL